ncbi:MAG: hypothetical protein M1828_003891 [Chrysothrix sp. TS-e1954]|nr:MAG: hypothetical protein M1828_003891 [Chrysothrix sp. TS-e1954]
MPPPTSTSTPSSSPPLVKIAACHLSPTPTTTSTLQKILTTIDTAATNSANLIVFPEAFLPGFPLFPAISAPVDTAGQFEEYVRASVYADGPEIGEVREKCRERGVVVSLGFSERSRASAGKSHPKARTKADPIPFTNPQKLVPTFWEKLVWSPGDGHGLVVSDTKTCGRVGALICGENTNPLARYALTSQSPQIHLMPFPPVWPTTRNPHSNYDNRSANAIRGASYAFEAKCFVVVCAALLDDETRAAAVEAGGEYPEGREQRREVLVGARQAVTQFFGPDGGRVGEEREGEEGIAWAEVDLGRCLGGKRLRELFSFPFSSVARVEESASRKGYGALG